MKTVRDILIEWLTQNQFEGLVNSDVGCGCGVDDLAPCSEDPMDCKAAYRRIATENLPDLDIEKGDTYYSTEPKTADGGEGRPA